MRRYSSLLFTAVLGLLFIARGVHATEVYRFDAQSDLSKWQTKGTISLDESRRHGDSGSAIKIEPGSSALLSLRNANGAGRVSLWVFDDGTAPPNPKENHTGPRWGILQADGRVLVVGAFYARYLAGDEAYAISDSDQKAWFNVQYLGTKREPQWRNWVFDFDPEKGMSLLIDGQPHKRFDWNKTTASGFVGVALFGDAPGSPKPQTFWVDDVEVTLGGPMQVKPTPPPPPPPVAPDKDPVLEGAAPKVKLTDHPRLLFTADELREIKSRYESKDPAIAQMREKLLAYLPSSYAAPTDKKFLGDATDGQRQGLWRLPTVAFHYLMTGDKKSLEAAVGYMKLLAEMEHWETGKEMDSGMSSANIMIGAALAFDWLYHDLDPAFREQFRKKLWLMARAQYYGGHLMKNPGQHYWQGDPANNHRWHRDAGMTLAVLTAYTGAPEEQWLLAKTFEELKYITEWLPRDGTSHESPTYMVFGAMHLTLAEDAADRCFGTDYLNAPFFRNIGRYLVAGMAPGPKLGFSYGDNTASNPIDGSYAYFLYRVCAKHHLADIQAVVDERVKEFEPTCAWAGLLWRDPSLTGGTLAKFPTVSFWPDIGWAVMRESWQDGTVGAAFKCGPFGGYRLNEYRNQNDFKYINVAHDDPDANSFIVINDNEYLAETDRYSSAKRSSNYNTILINGMGQMTEGRPEPQGFSQPGGGDMTKMAVITAWKDAGDVVMVEGEAAGSYLAFTDKKAGKSRPALDRFRRTFVWVKGGYILVLDDIRAPQPVTISWLMQGGKLETIDAGAGRYRLSKNNAHCDFQLLCDAPVKTECVTSTADHRGTTLGWQQLHANTETTATRFVSVFDPWHRQLKLAVAGEKITVTGPSFTDTWQWKPAIGKFDASSLHGTRAGGFDVTMDATTAKPPTP